MLFNYIVLLLVFEGIFVLGLDDVQNADLQDEFDVQEKISKIEKERHLHKDVVGSGDGNQIRFGTDSSSEKEKDWIGDEVKYTLMKDHDNEKEPQGVKPIRKMNEIDPEVSRKGKSKLEGYSDTHDTKIGKLKKNVKNDSTKDHSLIDDKERKLSKSEIVNEPEDRKPTDSWLIRVRGGKKAKIRGKTRPTISGKKKSMPTKVSTPTKQSLQPTAIHETFATTISYNATGTPSKNPTLEAVSTPQPQNDTEISGSGLDDRLRYGKIHGKSEMVEEGMNLTETKTEESTKSHKKEIKTVNDNEDGSENESGEEEEEKENTQRNGVENVEESMQKDEQKTVLCVGDSITEGYYNGGKEFHPYSKKLSELLNAEKNSVTYTVYNEGKSGECVDPGMTDRMPSLMQKYKPVNLVIILGGTNDFTKTNCNEHNLFESVKKLHDIAHEAGSKTVAVTIPDSNAEQLPGRNEKENVWKIANDKLRDYANNNNDNVILCDLAEELPYRTLTDDEKKKYWDDNLHYNPAGYDRMAELIYDDIQGNF